MRLSIGVADTGIASGYIDPVTKIAAQDEAVYTHTAIQMAVHGGWLTPMFLDRFALYKPPLLYWASGLSARIFGVTPFALRLPSLLAGAFLITLVFWWVRQSWGAMAAVGCSLLLASDHLFHTLGRLNLTDALLTSFIAGAAFCLFQDPDLQSRRMFLGFTACSAAAILTKGIAGLIPLLTVGLFWVLRKRWNLTMHYLKLCLATTLFASPWFIYQLLTHQQWFWAEFILVENIAFGTGTPPQTTEELHGLFYIRRMITLDPLVTLLGLAGIPFWWKRRSEEGVLLLAWIAVTAIALLSYQYRNAAYLLPTVAAFAILAAPLAQFRIVTTALLPAALLLKLYFPGEPWGLSFETGTTLTSAPPLESYCDRNRGNTLIVVETDDEFYSAVLPLEHVRYCFLSPNLPPKQYALDFQQLGIILTSQQYNQIDAGKPVFRERLREWGLNSDRAVGTVILARSQPEIASLIDANPADDFFLPAVMIVPEMLSKHTLAHTKTGRVFLLSKIAKPGHPHEWGCEL